MVTAPGGATNILQSEGFMVGNIKMFAKTLLLTAAPSIAQLRIHDAKRDAAAQEAKKTAEKIQSGDVFRKQSANLQILVDRDVATTVADAKIEMESMINGLRQ